MLRVTNTFVVFSLVIMFSFLSCRHPGTEPEFPHETDNAKLENLTVSIGTLTPDFSSDKYKYTVSVENAVTCISIIPVAKDERATIKVNDNVVPSGDKSPDIELEVGSNKIEVAVAIRNGSEKVYSLLVTRAGSANALLSSLSVSDGTQTPPLSPPFSSDVNSYTTTVEYCVEYVTVTAVAADESSIIKVNDKIVSSGQPSEDITLSTGKNTVTITVTAQDGSENVYSLTIIRHFSSNADLGSLVVSTGKLVPVFSSEISAYYVSVGNREQNISVIPKSSDSRATIAVRINQSPPSPVTSGTSSSGLPIAVGENTLEIEVTAEDGGKRTYSISVERAALLPPSNISVSKNNASMVVLSWNAATDAERYYISRSTAPNAGFTEFASTAELSYSDASAVPGVVYYYIVCSWNSATGASPVTASYEGYRTVSSPTSVCASDGLADRITVTWDSVVGAASYEVYKALGADGAYSKVSAEVAGTAFDDLDCIPGKLYAYKIKAKGADMTGDLSASDSGYRDIADPTNLRATDDIRNREINVSWTAVIGADVYLVYRSASSMDGYIQIGSSTSTAYGDTGVDFHTTYYYKIRAYAESAAIYSDYVGPESGYCYLSPPSGINASDTLVDKIRITWSPVPGAERYSILRATNDPGNLVSYISLFDTTVTVYDDTSAIPGVVYYYMVASVAGKSSTLGSYDQGMRLLAAPSDVGASDGYRAKVVIKWSQVRGASTYNIYRSSSSSGSFSLYTYTNAQSYADTNVSMGNNYYYMVTASNNGAGESAKSPWVLGICGSNIDAPDNIDASDGLYTNKIKISWNRVNDNEVKGYDVWRADSVSGPYSRIGSTLELWYDDTSVTSEKIYFYKVRTCCSSFFSRLSIYDTGYMNLK